MQKQPLDTEAKYQLFLEFVSAFYRDAGWEEPRIESDPHAPTAFETTIDEVVFSIGYDPLASGDANLFAYCTFGVIPLSAGADMLRRLLEGNLDMARHRDATYCIDADTRELGCYMRRTLDVDVQDLKADMAQLAEHALDWRNGPSDRAGGSAEWNMFA